jgi:hypothetical protein
MNPIDELVEQRIKAAQEKGEFDNLPGHGQHIILDDTSMVPEELRVDYRILKNAGYLPAQMQLRKEIEGIEQLLKLTGDEELQKKQASRLCDLFYNLM